MTEWRAPFFFHEPRDTSREAEEDEYFYRFSLKAYPVGINIVLYAMTH